MFLALFGQLMGNAFNRPVVDSLAHVKNIS